MWRTPILLVGLLVPTGHASDDKLAALAPLEGTWQVTSIEVAGVKDPAGLSGGGAEWLVVKGARATFFARGEEMPTFKDLGLEAAPKAGPQALDLVRGGKEVLPCLFEVEGDALKLAMPLVPVEPKPEERLSRPESFESKGKSVVVLVAKRSKD